MSFSSKLDFSKMERLKVNRNYDTKFMIFGKDIKQLDIEVSRKGFDDFRNQLKELTQPKSLQIKLAFYMTPQNLKSKSSFADYNLNHLEDLSIVTEAGRFCYFD